MNRRALPAAYEQLKRRLLAGEFPLRVRLGEERLAALLGVSRTPVRQALTRLHAERLVERHADGGYARRAALAEFDEPVRKAFAAFVDHWWWQMGDTAAYLRPCLYRSKTRFRLHGTWPAACEYSLITVEDLSVADELVSRRVGALAICRASGSRRRVGRGSPRRSRAR
jgi:DNA-binding transcriptional MocR family regulator